MPVPGIRCAPCNPDDCCTLEDCERRLGRASARPRIRIGTSLGMRDEPLNAFLKLRRYDGLAAALVEWVQCPNDLCAVAAMLGAGLVDVAALPAEDAVLQVATRPSLRVCGALRGEPRAWGLLARSGGPQRRARRLALPGCLGARMMAAELREDAETAAIVGDAELTEYACLAEALHALAAPGSTDAVLWELTPQDRAALEPLRGVRVLRELQMPWPSHLFVATREVLRAKLGTVKSFLRFSNLLSRRLRAEDAPLDYFKELYELSAAQVAPWLRTARWEFSLEVDASALSGPLGRLRSLQLLPGGDEALLARRLAPGVLVYAPPAGRASGDSASSGEEPTAFEEGARPPLSGARLHHFLPELSEALLCPRLPCRFKAQGQRLLAAVEPPESAELPPECVGGGPGAALGLGLCPAGGDEGRHEPVPAG